MIFIFNNTFSIIFTDKERKIDPSEFSEILKIFEFSDGPIVFYLNR